MEKFNFAISDDESESNECSLEKFQKTWKEELERKKRQNQNINQTKDKDISNDISLEEEAKMWFEKGTKLESQGKFYNAVTCYRRALQLVPDIEYKMYRIDQNINYTPTFKSQVKNESTALLEENLPKKFNKLHIDNRENFITCETTSDRPNFSSLPYEVILYIIRWLVSDNLDFYSLEQFAFVCKGFYIASRDPFIWKLACIRIWGMAKIYRTLKDYKNDWRTMFIERPKPNFNGAYISKATYFREGEKSFQVNTYRPYYLVEYYRYLRFFPRGFVLMLNTPDDPLHSLPKLRYRTIPNEAVISGHYTIQGDKLISVFKSANNENEKHCVNNLSQTEYHLTLQIKSVKRRNSTLKWIDYSVIYRRGIKEIIDTFDLNYNKFPLFRFSKVKSFSSTSNKILT